MNKQKHRIIPGHLGGEYTEGNVLLVQINKCKRNNVCCHSLWQFCNWQLWGLTEDYCAWKGLAGVLGKEEIIEKLHREGVRRAVETNKRRKTGTYSPLIQSLGGKAAIKSRIEKDLNYQSRVGKKGGDKCAKERIGFCGFTFEQRSAQSKTLYYDPDHPELGQRVASSLARLQKKNGYPPKPENRKRVEEKDRLAAGQSGLPE